MIARELVFPSWHQPLTKFNFAYFSISVSNVLATLGGQDFLESADFNLLPLDDPSSCPRPAQFPQRARRPKAALTGGNVVVCGGSTGPQRPRRQCYVYNETSDEWLLRRMDMERDGIAMAQLNADDFWVIGKKQTWCDGSSLFSYHPFQSVIYSYVFSLWMTLPAVVFKDQCLYYERFIHWSLFRLLIRFGLTFERKFW